MPKFRHIIAGLHVPHQVRVDLPERHSFDPWVRKQLDGWHEIKGRYRKPWPTLPLRFTLSPVNVEELWCAVYPDRVDEIRHDLRALIHGEHARYDVCVLDFDDEPHDPIWDRGWVLSALRLYAPGDVRPGPSLIPATADEKGVAFDRLDWRNVPSWHDLWLTDAEADGIPAFFSALHPVMHAFEHPRLAIPRRYYAKALHHPLDVGTMPHPEREFQAHHVPLEDVAYLLTAALEALFTLGSGHGPGVKLQDRFVERIVRFWDGASPSTVPLRELLVWAYDVRSEVAHGSFEGFEKKAKHRHPFGPAVNDLPPTFVAHLRNLTRTSILAVAGVIASGMAPKTLAKALDSVGGDATYEAALRAVALHRADLPRLGGDRDIAITHRTTVEW